MDIKTLAYAIFETMNDRGRPISPVDMLKAYLLAPVEDAGKRRTANEIWRKQVVDLISWNGVLESERDANCIKAWFRAQYAETTRERSANSKDRDWELIGSPFHRWARDNHARLGLGRESGNLELMTTDFPFFARAYRRILGASMRYTPGWEAVFYNAHNDFTWQNTVLLAPLVTTDDDETVRRKIVVTATYLDIWLMRRVVNYIRVGYSTTSYAMWLLCRDIRHKPLDELVDTLTKRLRIDDVTFEGSRQRGRRGIDDLGLNQFSRRYIFHLLARITAFIEAGSGRPDAFAHYVDRNAKNPFDIEHIWPAETNIRKLGFASPDEFHDSRNHVASLLLLPADVNRSLQDKSYGEKVPHYAKQNFYAASLAASAYQHQPQFGAFRAAHNLPFKSYVDFGKREQVERKKLVKMLVSLLWSPTRLNGAAE